LKQVSTGINIRTAQHYVKKYNDDEETRLPFNVKKAKCGRKPKLAEIHSQFLVSFIDEHPTAILQDISFVSKFSGTNNLHILFAQAFSAKCRVTLKKL
jgi:hypothetical protein